MLYGSYRVRECGKQRVEQRENEFQTRYICELVNENGHMLSFRLLLDGCVGAPRYREQYEAIAPHLEKGQFLDCEFAYRWHGSFLQLGLTGILIRGKKPLSDADDWLRFPGLITLEGQSYLPTRFHPQYPEFTDGENLYGDDPGRIGALHWKKRGNFISRLFRF